MTLCDRGGGSKIIKNSMTYFMDGPSVDCLMWVHVVYWHFSSGRLKRNVYFHYRRCLEGNHVQSVLLKEVMIEPNVKLECVPKFCYLGDTLGAGGGVEEAASARAQMRCAWAMFKELAPILTWAMKAENLHSLERNG